MTGMPRIARDSLLSLEAYARQRKDFRARVIAHKRHRKVALGESLTLAFEDELTIRYQIQEMLRIERIFEEDGIRSELDAYNPLVPDGHNLKATMMLEYPDAAERKRLLARLKGVEDRVWIRVEGCERVYAVADEDIDRENEEKTSSVHFLRFELAADMVQKLKRDAALAAGVDHPAYRAEIPALAAERAGRAGCGPGVIRLGAPLLAVALWASGCGGSKSRVDVVGEGEEPGAPREAAVKLPAYPKEQELLPFKVQPQTALEYFVDRTSVSVYNDGVDAIVRFTVVARSAQAENVSYEGFRCIERERKVYAYGRRDGTWLPVKDSGWLPLGPR